MGTNINFIELFIAFVLSSFIDIATSCHYVDQACPFAKSSNLLSARLLEDRSAETETKATEVGQADFRIYLCSPEWRPEIYWSNIMLDFTNKSERNMAVIVAKISATRCRNLRDCSVSSDVRNEGFFSSQNWQRLMLWKEKPPDGRTICDWLSGELRQPVRSREIFLNYDTLFRAGEKIGRFFFFFFLISLVGLWVLRTLTGLLYQPRMISDGDCGEIGGMSIGKGNRSVRRKICPSATLSTTNLT
jgi:hypothetical protein